MAQAERSAAVTDISRILKAVLEDDAPDMSPISITPPRTVLGHNEVAKLIANWVGDAWIECASVTLYRRGNGEWISPRHGRAFTPPDPLWLLNAEMTDMEGKASVSIRYIHGEKWEVTEVNESAGEPCPRFTDISLGTVILKPGKPETRLNLVHHTYWNIETGEPVTHRFAGFTEDRK